MIGESGRWCGRCEHTHTHTHMVDMVVAETWSGQVTELRDHLQIGLGMVTVPKSEGKSLGVLGRFSDWSFLPPGTHWFER